MLTVYLLLSLWFMAADLLAGLVAEVKPRPFAAAVLGLLWPLSMPFALLASAVIIRRYRERLRGCGEAE